MHIFIYLFDLLFCYVTVGVCVCTCAYVREWAEHKRVQLVATEQFHGEPAVMDG